MRSNTTRKTTFAARTVATIHIPVSRGEIEQTFAGAWAPVGEHQDAETDPKPLRQAGQWLVDLEDALGKLDLHESARLEVHIERRTLTTVEVEHTRRATRPQIARFKRARTPSGKRGLTIHTEGNE